MRVLIGRGNLSLHHGRQTIDKNYSVQAVLCAPIIFGQLG